MHLPLLAVLLAATPAGRLVAQATPSDAPPPKGSQLVPYDAERVPPEPGEKKVDAAAPLAPAARSKALPFETRAPEAQAPRERLLGVQLAAGVPDGAVLSVVARPVKWARANVGLAHNILGLGVQGGVTIVPFHFAVTPTLNLEAGRFFETDVSDKAPDSFPSAFDPSLRKFGYTYYSAQAGLELGSHNGFLFFLRGGLSWLRSGLDGVSGYRPSDAPNTTVDVSNLKLSATIPTVNLGFLYYVW